MPLVDNLVSGFQEGMAVFCGESEFNSYGRQALWLEGSERGGQIWVTTTGAFMTCWASPGSYFAHLPPPLSWDCRSVYMLRN